MSDTDDNIKVGILSWLKKQSSIFIFIVFIIVCVVFLSYESKNENITYVLASGLISIIIIICLNITIWIGQRIDAVLAFIPIINVIAVKNNLLLEELLRNISSLTISYSNITKALFLKDNKNIILIVEDSRLDAAATSKYCLDLSIKYKMNLKVIGSLADCNFHLSQCVCIILDIGLPNSDLNAVKRFVSEASNLCPIIIYSGSEYKKEDFPSATAIITKHNREVLRKELESILNSFIFN